ncbi:tyrosine-type recombinase/integrase [Rhodococcus qingshengii]
MHSLRYTRQGDDRPISEWIKTQPPHIADHQFSLIHVDEVLRWEVLYAVQRRDARGGRIEPHAIRTALVSMQTVTSLATMSEADATVFLKRHGENSTAAHLAEFVRHLRRGHDRMNGLGPKDRLVWDLVEIGLSPDPTVIGGARKRKGLDFGQISQPWLRDLALGWAREQATARGIPETLRVSVIASQALDTRHDRGIDMTALGDRDIAAIIDAINRTVTVADGTPVQAKYKRQLANFLFALIEWGRHFGNLTDLPVLFRMPHHSATPFENVVDEESGKAIPSAIQRQLDDNIDSIGRTSAFGKLTQEQAHQMFRTAYIVLRDTGRRPLEVVTLTTSCLTRDHSGSVLTWNNHKSKRFGRRLPILESTAEVIQRWMDIRSTLTTADRSADYLFPGKAVKSREPHLRTHWLSSAIRQWVNGFDRLDTHDLGDDGELIPFDRKLVYPYAFRHSYAQRHADNGTPIDVLRDLMDHRNIQTTAEYYVVTADRKREAIAAVGKYSVDRVGNSTPHTDSTAYQMRSVAVPFGNCIEPTNVKAGGHACPIRFQCAGCGFYRPDPSYLPAIEEHLNTLRSDREIARAMDTAPYVIENLTAQITSFDHVLATMRDKLAQLDPAERDRVEDAATVLRRARAGVLLPLTVTERTTSS